jgi:hypothetical protein
MVSNGISTASTALCHRGQAGQLGSTTFLEIDTTLYRRRCATAVAAAVVRIMVVNCSEESSLMCHSRIFLRHEWYLENDPFELMN